MTPLSTVSGRAISDYSGIVLPKFQAAESSAKTWAICRFQPVRPTEKNSNTGANNASWHGAETRQYVNQSWKIRVSQSTLIATSSISQASLIF